MRWTGFASYKARRNTHERWREPLLGLKPTSSWAGEIANLVLGRKEEQLMRKAVIPVIFVVCGALASSLWSKVRFPFGVPKLDIVSGSASDLGFWALRGGFQFAKEVPGSPRCVVPVLFRVVLRKAFEGLPGGRGEDKSGRSNSWHFVRRMAGRSWPLVGERHFVRCPIELSTSLALRKKGE
jgi:hypothetical protein